MSKSKDLRKLVDKIKDDISIQIERIVEWNLDESKIVHRLYRQSKNNDEEIYLNEKSPDISPSYIVKTIEPSMLKIMNFPISLVLAILIKI